MAIFLPKNIALLRQRNGLSQTDLARIIGKKRSVVGSYESGTSEPSIETIIKIAEYFGIGVADIIESDLARIIGDYGDDGKSAWHSVKNSIETLKVSYNRILQIIELREKAFGEDNSYDSYLTHLKKQFDQVIKYSSEIDKVDPDKLLIRLDRLCNSFEKDFEELFDQYYADVILPRRMEKFTPPKNVIEWI